MASPQLLGSGSTTYDTQRVYTTSGPGVGAFGVLDGRGYVWCSHTGSGTLTRGEPLVAADINRQTQNLATSTNALNVGMTVITGITAGLAAIAANTFQGGYMVVVDGSGEGNIYRIRDHTAFTASTADGSVVLDDPIVVASDANTEISLVANKYANPRRSRSLARDPFIGVPSVTVPAGDSITQYFWAQRTGLCPVFVEGTPLRGTSVMVSRRNPGRLASVTQEIEVETALSAGSRTVHELDLTPVVGQMVTDGIDGEVQVVDLQNAMF